jgi:hypothetical protein
VTGERFAAARVARTLLAAALAAAALAAGAPAPAQAAGHACPRSYTVYLRLSAVSRILSVRGLSCRSALAVVRRYGRHVDAFSSTGRFRLGPWRCTRYGSGDEDYWASCVHGRREFRVDYGA